MHFYAEACKNNGVYFVVYTVCWRLGCIWKQYVKVFLNGGSNMIAHYLIY